MASSGTVNKVDLSLDDIIKLNKSQKKQQQGAGGGLGRARGRGRGRGRGGKPVVVGQQQDNSSGAGGTKPGGLARKKRGRGRGTVQKKAQQLQQKARQTLALKKKKQQEQSGQQQSVPHVSNIKLRLGKRGKMKKRGGGQAIGAGGSEGGTSRPGSRLKAIREMKQQRAGTRGRGRGRGIRGEALKQVMGRGGNSQENTESPVGARGRGRGRRGRGRGRSSIESGQETSSQPLEIFAPSPFEPVGLNLPVELCAEQHTSKSLHNRFTPTMERNRQRMVQRGGRTVNFHS